MPPVTNKDGILTIICEHPERIRKLFIEKGYERLADDIIGEAKKQGVSFRVLPREAFSRQAKGVKDHVCLEADEFSYTDQDAFLGEMRRIADPLLCAFDGIYDPQNLGNIVRSSACFGVDALILPREHSCGVNETVAKISRGAVDHAKIVRVTNLARYLDEIKRLGIFCYGLDEKGTLPLSDIDLTGPVCLVLGKEDGLRRLTREKCDQIVRIPTAGSFSSLNVATCFAVSVYEARRQRGRTKII
jgi:23S rRNA (guanosine2251-2'-O)-methyltransferase